jgi:ribosomal protein L33
MREESKMRVKITLQCTETGDRNYITTKNKRNDPERLELKKKFSSVETLYDTQRNKVSK